NTANFKSFVREPKAIPKQSILVRERLTICVTQGLTEDDIGLKCPSGCNRDPDILNRPRAPYPSKRSTL
ncbi:MAG: hypothetical protein VXB09_04475, partial [Gammaproteobacteria bacterium]